MENWLSVLGSIASIGGAGWAFHQARRSRRFATQAQTIRDELGGFCPTPPKGIFQKSSY